MLSHTLSHTLSYALSQAPFTSQRSICSPLSLTPLPLPLSLIPPPMLFLRPHLRRNEVWVVLSQNNDLVSAMLAATVSTPDPPPFGTGQGTSDGPPSSPFGNTYSSPGR